MVDSEKLGPGLNGTSGPSFIRSVYHRRVESENPYRPTDQSENATGREQPGPGIVVKADGAAESQQVEIGLVLLLAPLLWRLVSRNGYTKAQRLAGHAFMAFVVLQFLLGVLTVIWHVPVAVADEGITMVLRTE